ncbi:hypothetical protein BDW74DRAFT_188125 [Aspergillus multicolor]|uniref:uncharacterized protein n=1 Tax=Aspergillus multicolor TaxID=41759 RepID=UPI003CCE18C3
MAIPKPFLTAVIGAAVSLQLLILANMSYLYGSAYRDGSRFSTMKMLYVDYDGGVIGRSVSTAYDQIKGPEFPSLHQHSQEEYPGVQDIQEAVCKGDYWGAIYSGRDASSRLASVLFSPETAKAYDNSQALGYAYSGTKYPAYSQIVSSNLIQLAQAAAGNTVSMVMPIIIQFFFMMAMNGISMQNHMFNTFSARRNTILWFIISICCTFIAALVMAGYIWAFREHLDVSSGQFALTWMAIWLTMHVHFLLIDFATAVIPMPFMPYFILTWIILNVTSTLRPFELSPGFFRIGYIWTDGRRPYAYRTLPFLWCEWVVGVVLFVVGMGLLRTKASFKTLLSKERSEA